MKIKRRSKIIVETEEVTVVRRSGETTTTWCPQCNRDFQVVTSGQRDPGFDISSDQDLNEIEGDQSAISENQVETRLLCEHGFDSPRQDSEEVDYEK